MSYKVLLLIKDDPLRQLYHELLYTQYAEIIPFSTIEDAIAALAVSRYTALVLYPDDMSEHTIDSFLHLLHKIESFAHTRLLIITIEPEIYSQSIRQNDSVIGMMHLDPSEVALKIKHILSQDAPPTP